MAHLLRTILPIALLAAAATAQAAGLGKLTVNSALGEVFDADIDLVSVKPGELDTLSARIATADNVRPSPVLRALRFSVEKRADGQPYVKVSSIAPVNEPSIDAPVELTWLQGRVQRQYSILLDPRR